MKSPLQVKRLYFAAACVAASLLFHSSSFAQTITPSEQREGPEHAQNAAEFIEALHTTPPGMNWKKVNDAVRSGRIKRMKKNYEGAQGDLPVVKGAWTEVGSNNQSGRVIAIDYDNETGLIYVAGAGGTIWRGTSQGSDYEILNEFQRISYPQLVKQVTHDDFSVTLIAVSNQPRAYTLDEGDDLWSESTGFEENQRWGGISKAVWCKRNGRLEIITVGNEWDYNTAWKARSVVYRSVDSGKSFQRERWFDGARSIWTDHENNTLIVHGDTLSAFNIDGSFTTVTIGGSFAGDGSNVIIAGNSINDLLMSRTSNGITTFKHSVDGGASWRTTGSLDVGPFHQSSFARAVDASEAWLFGGVEVWRSTDDGASWATVSKWGEYYNTPESKLHADIPAIVSLHTDEGPITFILTDGGLFRSSDGAATVKNISLEGLNVSQYYGSYTSRDNINVVSAGAQDQGYQRSRTQAGGAPRDFDQLISGDYARLSSGDGGHSIFCVYPGFTLYWPDAESGGRRNSLEFPHSRHLWLPPLAVNPNKPNEALLGGGRIDARGTRLYIYRLVGNALKLDSVDHDFGQGADNVSITAVTVAETDPVRQYVVTSDGLVWSSQNEGLTWKKNNRPEGLEGHYFGGNALAVDPTNSSTVYLGGSGYGQQPVWVSTDAGATFRALDGMPQLLVYGLAVSSDGNLIAAATDAGAFVYDVSSQTWSDITEQGGPDQTYWHADWIPPLQRFRFSTYGRGLWDFVPNPTTSVPSNGHLQTYQLTLMAVSTLTGGGFKIIEADSEPLTALETTWYDVGGRILHKETLQSGQDGRIYERPRGVGPGSLVVVVDARGRVGASVIP